MRQRRSGLVWSVAIVDRSMSRGWSPARSGRRRGGAPCSTTQPQLQRAGGPCNGHLASPGRSRWMPPGRPAHIAGPRRAGPAPSCSAVVPICGSSAAAFWSDAAAATAAKPTLVHSTLIRGRSNRRFALDVNALAAYWTIRRQTNSRSVNSRTI